MKAVRLTVRGRVQRVFYREWTVRAARELGVLGWVRNCPDGTVAALVQGEAVAVDRLIEGMRSGPPAPRVEAVEQVACDPQDLTDFSRR